MNDPDVESILIGRLAEGRGCTPDEVRLDLERTGGIDSLEGVELAIEAEQRFGIAIPDDALSSDVCRSVAKLATLVRSKLSPNDATKGVTDR